MADPLINLMAALADGRVWIALGVACLSVALMVPLGVFLARRTGLLGPDADAVETFAVGLALGLVWIAATWAAVASGGRSAYLPTAVAFLLAIAVGSGWSTIRPRLTGASARGTLAVVAVLVGLGLLYATTIAPSPRNGQQPLEFFDVGFYSVLGADLAETGVETIYSPTGFEATPGLPEQTWYHWGEVWLAAAIIDLTGISPIHARHLVVLPVLLLAVAALVGALARRAAARTTEYLIIAAAAALFLAPIPLVRDPEIEWLTRSIVVNITQYGLAAVVILLGIQLVHVRRPALATRSGRILAGAIAGALIASHIGLAAVAAAALVGVAAITLAIAVIRHEGRALGWSTTLRSVRGWSVGLLVPSLTLIWGFGTGHGLGGLGGMQGIAPFDPAWRSATLAALVGAGVLLVGVVPPVTRAAMVRPHAGLILGAAISLLVGVVTWGLLVSDLNMFHVFSGTFAVIVTPIAIIAVLAALQRLRAAGRSVAASLLLALILLQTMLSGMIAALQLQALGPIGAKVTAVSTLYALRVLPAGAKAAYACDPLENFAPWDASLIALDAHTGVRLIPMCFMADRARRILGRPLDEGIESPFFRRAEQRSLFPDADARPTSAAIRRFLADHEVGYIYADPWHPNTLVPDAELVYSTESTSIFRVEPLAD